MKPSANGDKTHQLKFCSGTVDRSSGVPMRSATLTPASQGSGSSLLTTRRRIDASKTTQARIASIGTYAWQASGSRLSVQTPLAYHTSEAFLGEVVASHRYQGNKGLIEG